MSRHRLSLLLASLGLLLVLLVQGDVTPLWAQSAAAEPAAADDQEWDDLESFGEQVSVDVVNLDVWVTDGSGQPVTGLDRDAFEISIDGDPVKVTNFAAFAGSAGSGAQAKSGAEGKPWEVAPKTRLEIEEGKTTFEQKATPPEEQLYLLVLVDDWALRPEDRARVFQDLRGFLDDVTADGDQVAVAVHNQGLQMAQNFTDDPARIKVALDRVEKLAPAGIRLAQERRQTLKEMQDTMEAAERDALRARQTACDLAIGGLQGVAERYAASTQGHVQSSASALATTAQVVSGVPGRKAVLYVGNGLAQTAGMLMFEYVGEMCPHYRSQLSGFQQQYDMSPLYEEVAARANQARVTIYTLEAQSAAIDLGLDRAGGGSSSQIGSQTTTQVTQNADGSRRVADGGFAEKSQAMIGRGGSTGRRFVPSTHLQRLERQDEQSSLVLIAGQTGGRAFLNAGDFRHDFERLATDLRTYYSLGFAPIGEGDGQLHRVEVKVRGAEGKDYQVRHRLRYRSETLAERMASRVRGVAQFGTESNPLGARVEMGEAVPTAGGKFRVPVRIWVPFDRLTLVASPGSQGGERQGKLLVLMATTNAKGQLLPVRQKEVPIHVGSGAGDGQGPREHLVEIELVQTAGSHHVALGLRDELGGETSYLEQRFRVPGAQVADQPDTE